MIKAEQKAGGDLAEDTSFFLKSQTNKTYGFVQIQGNTKRKVNTSDQLPFTFFRACGRYSEFVRFIASNPDLQTHEFSNFGFKSNNLHTWTQVINPRLFVFGWWIAVYRTEHSQKSWRWRLTTIEQALRLDLHPLTRERLEALILQKEAGK